MREFRIGQAAALLGVSVDTVRRWADGGRLATTRTSGGHRVVRGSDLAALASTLRTAPEPEAIGAQSARNRFTGIVTAVTKDKVMAQVEIQAGPHRVVSLMSREAADDLALEPGVLAIAVVKATNVVIETPAGPSA
jgi:molybdopterin-binding protein